MKKNGEEFLSGGFIIEDTPLNRKILDSLPINEQLDFVKSFKKDPFIKFYYNDNDTIPDTTIQTGVNEPEVFSNEKKRQLLKDVSFPKGLGFFEVLRMIIWDVSRNDKKINTFYNSINIGKSVKFSYRDALNA